MYRTHTCGELRPAHVGQRVTLAGWVDTYRDHSGVLFVDLRDRYGKTQVVFSPEKGEGLMAVAKMLRPEYVVAVTGTVVRRPEGTENPKLATGEIELRAEEVRILNKSLTPPFHPSAKDLPGEEVRLKYRYIDLRRPEMQETLILRHRMIKIMRDYFDALGFIEVETPMLGKSTPEGARDYLVPSRIQPGCFYALPQSPQLYKQILMVAGFDRYVQIARCFRDEDLRADRQPEFTQLDLEMSFVEAEDVMAVVDGLIARLAKELLGLEVSLPLPRMTYDEAMERFGHDAPDLRFGMELVDVSELAAATESAVFRQAVATGGKVRGMTAPGASAVLTRKNLDELTEYVVHDFGVKGLSWIKVESDGQLVGPAAKFFEGDFRSRLLERMQAGPGDIMFFVADRKDQAGKALYGLRRRLGAELKLYDPSKMHFSWVVEFPMFEFDETEGRWVAMHHPFTSPRLKDIPLLDTDPGACRAQAYDLVINGYEAGGGTIRIHDQELQQKVFGILGMDAATAKERFGFLLDALQYGAPPHGGIALGVDRLVMLFSGRDNIRDCIAFPKTQRAVDLMTGAPSPVDPKQLRELGIRLM
ncbi:MAG: aspartate--tRNA ligase [Thermoguttaceae bacterium]|nr:aspartate--tRNA ligase [Thermoguttaceae bacterium]MDW8079632.1 aspartate--tRNA ligase [Thermoguttaceae bacterium]